MKKLYLSFFLLLFIACPFNALAQVDTTIGIKAPGKVSKNYKKLAHYLCDDIASDRLKVNAIYNWISHNIKYDVKAMQQGLMKEDKPETVLKKKKALCDGYSRLLAAMCKEVGINAVVVDGYAKDWMFDNGDKLYVPRHAWNAVFVDFKWQLVDVTWAAGGVGQSPGWLKSKIKKAAKDPVQTSGKLKFHYNYSTAYFLPPPTEFRIRHLPADPVWQLTDSVMPLQVFEAGERAIKSFNEAYKLPSQDDLSLNQLAYLGERQQIHASAERVLAYNPRFKMIMASKHQAKAVDSVAALSPDASSAERNNVLLQVQQELKTSEGFLVEQKKQMKAEYTALKKKNKVKNQEAKKYITTVKNGNKRLTGQCEARIRAAETKKKTLAEKQRSFLSAQKKLDLGRFQHITTNNREEAASSPVLVPLEDSVRNRTARITALEAEEAQQKARIEALETHHKDGLNELANSLMLADSALVQETIGRINMYDSYDEEVIKWNKLVKEVRLEKADTLQRQFTASYDTLVKQYEGLRKVQGQQVELYKKNFRDLEQYKRRNSSNTELLSLHAQQSEAYKAAAENYLRTTSEQERFIDANKDLFGQLVKLYKRQDKLAGYMERSEEYRKEAEEKTLTKKEAFDGKEHEKQKEQLKQTGKKAERLLTRG